jgi:hypothetical protein
MKILFSIPAHESNEVVCNVIENIQKFIIEPIIVIHPNESFSDFDVTIPTKYQNVYVNPSRLHYTKYHSMLPILISNFEYTEHLDYDYHCIFHTNQLLIKPRLEDYLKDKEISFEYFSDDFGERARIMFESSKSDVGSKIGREGVYNSHMEGTFYTKEIFKKICEFIKEDMSTAIHCSHAVEETIIPMLAYHVFISNKEKMAYTYLKHTEQSQLSVDDVKGLLEKNKPASIFKGLETNTDNIFAIKPVHRSMNNPVREFINNLK